MSSDPSATISATLDRRLTRSPIPLLGALCLLGCSQGPEAAGGYDLDQICQRLHVTARDGRSAEFLAACREFIGRSSPFDELLRRLQSGEHDSARLDEAVGALDLGVRLLAEQSTEVHVDLSTQREAYLVRAVACLSALPPIYAQAMLNRWGQWGYLSPTHGPTLVRLALHPECRALALHQLAGFGPVRSLGEDELDLLAGLLDAQVLGSDEKASLISVLLTRSDDHDIVRLLDFIQELDSGRPRWDLIGVLLRGAEHETAIREAIEGIGALSWATETAHWRDLGRTNEVVSQIATGIFFRAPSSRRGRVALALSQDNRTFLEVVSVSADELSDRLLALEMLIRRHLSLGEAIEAVRGMLRRDGAWIASRTEFGALFLDALSSLGTRAAREPMPAQVEELKTLLVACRVAVPHPAQGQTLSALGKFIEGSGAR